MDMFKIFQSEMSEVFIVCISTALSLKLQSENAGRYIYFAFIYKNPCKIFIYITDFHNLMFYREPRKRLSIQWCNNIDILQSVKANIDIRKV